MTIEGMLTTILISSINILFLGIIVYIHVKNPTRYFGVRNWLYANLIVFLGFALVIIENNVVFNWVNVTGYILIVIGVIFAGNSLVTLSNRKFIHSKELSIATIVTVVLYILGLFVQEKAFFIIGVLITIIFFHSRMLLRINRNKRLNEKGFWVPFVMINAMAVFITIGFSLTNILLKQYTILNFVEYQGENFIINIIAITGTFTSIAVITALNSINPRFVSSENKLYKSVFNLTPNMIAIYNPKNRVIEYINPKFTEITGYSSNEVVKRKKITDFIIKENDVKPIVINDDDDTVIKEYQARIKTKTNKDIICLFAVAKIFYLNDIYYLASVTNITETALKTKKYEHLAKYDELTALPNRRAIIEKINVNISQQREFIFVLFDFDNFKLINDKYGHSVGDKLLTDVATRLKYLNDQTSLIARYGGDEFIVIFDYVNDRNADNKINNLINKFTETVKIDEFDIKINASFGVSKYPNDGITYDTLLKCADDALYHAKKCKKERFIKFKDIDETKIN